MIEAMLRGRRWRGRLGGALVAASLTLPLSAQTDGDTGADAFQRRDFQAAAALWREEAAEGSARAKLGLGLISDLGLGAPRDPAQAIRWYLEAAEDGLPEAQFNVGVMLDSGAGVPRDATAAAVWYARAAANGHRRAQYNLGLLYDSGEGTPRNHDLARYWLTQAARDLPAAAERLETLAQVPPEERTLAAPASSTAAIVTSDDARRVELVWTATPGPEGADFLVELARLPRDGETAGELVISQRTEGSALTMALPADADHFVWRVSRVDSERGHYAAEDWRRIRLGPDRDDGAPPRGRVTFRVAEGDAAARRLADELAAEVWHAGLWTRIEPTTEVPTESAVGYAYVEDQNLAVSLAEFLPVLTGEDAAPMAEPDAAPGEVVIWLVGGPRPS